MKGMVWGLEVFEGEGRGGGDYGDEKKGGVGAH